MTNLASHPNSIGFLPQEGILSLFHQNQLVHKIEGLLTSGTSISKSSDILQEHLTVTVYELSPKEDLQLPEGLKSVNQSSLLYGFPRPTLLLQQFQGQSDFFPHMSEISLNHSTFLPNWIESGTSASFLSELQINLLGKYYIFEEIKETYSFLRANPFLIQVLLNTYNKIKAYFPDSQVFLNFSTDNDLSDADLSETGSKDELVVSISTNSASEKAIEQLTIFYNDWWLRASKEARGKIAVGLEYT